MLDGTYRQKLFVEESEQYMRMNLKEARHKAGLTQKEVAEYLEISENAYQNIEYGKRIGKIENWDKLEDLFRIHQRTLRMNFLD